MRYIKMRNKQYKLNRLLKFQEAISDYQDVMNTNSSLDIQYSLNHKIEKLKTEIEFNIPISHSNCNHHIVSDNEFITNYGKKLGKTISWSDDGRQPEEGEELYSVSFPTGHHFLGPIKQSGIFDEFFNKLKDFSPKYSDTANKKLYFTKDNAHLVHEALPDLIKEYKDKALATSREDRINELQEQIRRLENL